MREMFTKHKIIGVQVPIAPPDTEEKKKVREMREMMKFRPPPRSQPASSPAKSSESKKPVRPKTKTKPKPKPKVEPKP